MNVIIDYIYILLRVQYVKYFYNDTLSRIKYYIILVNIPVKVHLLECEIRSKIIHFTLVSPLQTNSKHTQ